MINVHWLVLMVYGIVFMGSAVAVLFEKKEPAKTLAWLLVLFFLPVIGIVLYLVFGQDVRRKRNVNRRTMGLLKKRQMTSFLAQKNLVLPFEHRKLMQLFVNQDSAMPFKDNDIDIFVSGKALFDDMMSAIMAARQHVHLETFIIEDDTLGNRVADVLVKKAREGVEVRLLYDDVGCWRVPSKFFQRMKNAGVDVRSSLPVRMPFLTNKIDYRNHRKLCIIDGTTGYIGGMNIADRYISGANGQDWHDTHLRIKGNAVHGLQSAFLADWFFMDRKLITDHKYYPQPIEEIENNCFVQVVTSSSASKWCNIMQGYVNILNNAKKYVYMETPYFLPTPSVLSAMQSAALSGVDVRIVVPEKSDNWLVDVASRSFYPEVLKAGVKVYKYTKGFNHSKLLVCDDSLSTVGSTNIDARSFETNMEANAFIYDSDTAIRLRRVFENDLAESKIMAGYPREATFFVRLWESAIRLLAPLL